MSWNNIRMLAMDALSPDQVNSHLSKIQNDHVYHHTQMIDNEKKAREAKKSGNTALADQHWQIAAHHGEISRQHKDDYKTALSQFKSMGVKGIGGHKLR